MAHGKGQRGADRSKEDWLCKTCEGPDGKYKNFGFRQSCNRCGLAKGNCFFGKAPATANGRPATNLAERQARAQKKDSSVAERQVRQQLDAEKKTLQQQRQALAKERAALDRKKAEFQKTADEPEDDDDIMETAQLPFLARKSEQEFFELKSFLKSQGATDTDKEILEVEGRIQELRSASAAAKPRSPLSVAALQSEAQKEHALATAKVKRKANEVAQCQQNVKNIQAKLDAANQKLANLQKAQKEAVEALHVASAAVEKAAARYKEEIAQSCGASEADEAPRRAQKAEVSQADRLLNGFTEFLRSEMARGANSLSKEAMAENWNKLLEDLVQAQAQSRGPLDAGPNENGSGFPPASVDPIDTSSVRFADDDVMELERQADQAKRALEAVEVRLDSAKKGRVSCEAPRPTAHEEELQHGPVRQRSGMAGSGHGAEGPYGVPARNSAQSS